MIEALASGIPTVLRTLSEAGMVPPKFYDQGIRFTVRVPNHALLAIEDIEWRGSLTPTVPLSDQQRHALVAMRHGVTWTNQTLRESFPMDSREATRVLGGLVEAGVAIAEGERGGRMYRLASGLNQEDAELERYEEELVQGVKVSNAKLIADALGAGPRTLTELMASTGLTRRQVDYTLRIMRARGEVNLYGRRGIRGSWYELRAEPAK